MGRASELIRMLDLHAHPEGGYYHETYRSPNLVRDVAIKRERSAITEIYFMLMSGQFSRFHRVLQDELWHYIEGGSLELFCIAGDSGACERHLVGKLCDESEPLAVVPACCWQAARTTGEYSLVACTVGPGFDFEDFHLLKDCPEAARQISARYPELAMLI